VGFEVAIFFFWLLPSLLLAFFLSWLTLCFRNSPCAFGFLLFWYFVALKQYNDDARSTLPPYLARSDI
jgi:hypothetical protein